MTVRDEDLMAFVDDELPEAEAAEVAAAIAADPALAARAEAFRRSRALVAEALRPEAAGTEEQDDPLAALIRAAEARPRQPPAAANSNWRPFALTAALAAAVFLGGWGWLSLGPGSAPEQPPHEIARALYDIRSGASTDVGDVHLTAIASFENRAGELCREYETAAGDKAPTLHVACHEGGGWEKRFTLALADQGADYTPASGGIAALDEYLARTGAGAPLDPDAEAGRLASLAR